MTRECAPACWSLATGISIQCGGGRTADRMAMSAASEYSSQYRMHDPVHLNHQVSDMRTHLTCVMRHDRTCTAYMNICHLIGRRTHAMHPGGAIKRRSTPTGAICGGTDHRPHSLRLREQLGASRDHGHGQCTRGSAAHEVGAATSIGHAPCNRLAPVSSKIFRSCRGHRLRGWLEGGV